MPTKTSLAMTGIAVAWCLGVSPTQAQSVIKSAGVQARLAQVPPSYGAKNAFMGAVLVAVDEKLLLSSGYGKANLDWDIANTPDVKFRIGSLTKQFTAALILLLQEDGKLRISDPVAKYVADAPSAWSSVTVGDLLSHTSGIHDFTDNDDFPMWGMSPHSPAEELTYIEAKPLDFPTGQKFAYSNSNYEILGDIIEKVSGQTYGEMLRKRIFDPLGMVDTGVDTDELVLRHRAQGYTASKDGALVQARSESLTVPWAAGSLYSTSADLLRWERGLFSGKVLSASSLKAMTTPGKGDYGLGLVVQSKDNRKLVWHNGAIEGFASYLAYLPDKHVTVVVLSNVDGPVPSVMGAQLIDVALGKAVVLPSEHKAAPLSPHELARYVGQFRQGSDTVVEIGQVDGQPTLTRGKGAALDLLYEGQKGGHGMFYVPARYFEIEFIPNPSGVMSSAVMHYAGGDVTVKR